MAHSQRTMFTLPLLFFLKIKLAIYNLLFPFFLQEIKFKILIYCHEIVVKSQLQTYLLKKKYNRKPIGRRFICEMLLVVDKTKTNCNSS